MINNEKDERVKNNIGSGSRGVGCPDTNFEKILSFLRWDLPRSIRVPNLKFLLHQLQRYGCSHNAMAGWTRGVPKLTCGSTGGSRGQSGHGPIRSDSGTCPSSLRFLVYHTTAAHILLSVYSIQPHSASERITINNIHLL